jgi:hypothetical protein
MLTRLTILVLVLTLVVSVVQLRRSRARTRAMVRRLAMATGHPSAGSSAGAGWADRRTLADEAAHELAMLGLVATRRTSAPIVHARGAAGQYVLTIAGGGRVLAEYESDDDGTIELGKGPFGGIYAAVREIAAHAELPTPA